MARFWWILFFRGVLGLLLGGAAILWILRLDQPGSDLFGLALFLNPMAILATLVFLLGIYAVLDGAFALTLGLQDYGEGRRWWSLAAEGAFSILLGLGAWWSPNHGSTILLYWTAAWALFTGALEISQGVELNEYKERKKPFLFAGAVSVLFGLLILSFKWTGSGLIWAMGAYAFLFALPLLELGWRLRGYEQKHPPERTRAGS